MIWNNLDSVYFIGIGGIGMSALARYFASQGKNVAGYDRQPTLLTDELGEEGIAIHFQDKTAMIPAAFRNPERTLVIYTPAVPEDHHELAYFRNRGFRVIKRSAALGEVFNAGYGVAVAGTHGKTSVSTMIAHIVSRSAIGCNAFLGGISKNLKSNLIIDPASRYIIAEADEFDRSFLTLFPQVAVVTSMDADHLDIYHSHENLKKGFEAFISQIHDKGRLIIKSGLQAHIPDHLEVYTYSLSDPGANYYASSIERLPRGFRFSVSTPSNIIEGLTLNLYGRLNVENAIAAIAVADQLGVPGQVIATAIESFKGVRRRFDIHVDRPDAVYIDDYAHHPEELRAFITSVREAFPGKRLTGIFQPHLYTRTRDFAGGFATSLGLLDELLLLDIYPAREEPIKGVSSEMILNQVALENKQMVTKDRLLNKVKELKPEVLLTMGAGDIDKFVEPFKNYMEKR
ncbi:MAG: UDP-N-acetylmuramate--L-alanine ligase [Bacteroidota bacterium]